MQVHRAQVRQAASRVTRGGGIFRCDQFGLEYRAARPRRARLVAPFALGLVVLFPPDEAESSGQDDDWRLAFVGLVRGDSPADEASDMYCVWSQVDELFFGVDADSAGGELWAHGATDPAGDWVATFEDRFAQGCRCRSEPDGGSFAMGMYSYGPDQPSRPWGAGTVTFEEGTPDRLTVRWSDADGSWTATFEVTGPYSLVLGPGDSPRSADPGLVDQCLGAATSEPP